MELLELLELLGVEHSVELFKFVQKVMCSDLEDYLKAPVKPIMGLQ